MQLHGKTTEVEGHGDWTASELQPPAPLPFSLEVISAERIQADAQIRSIRDPAMDEDLSKSIASVGMLQPILVSWEETRKCFVLIAGHRRYEAALAKGLNYLPCLVVRSDLSQAERRRIQFTENYHRQQMNPMDLARVFRELASLTNLKQAELADYLGLSQATISEHLQLFKLSEREQEWLAAGQLGFKEALGRVRRGGKPKRQLPSRGTRGGAKIDYGQDALSLTQGNHLLPEHSWVDGETGLQFVVTCTSQEIPTENVLWALRRRISLLERSPQNDHRPGRSMPTPTKAL